MALPKKYDFNDYDNYLTDENPTTSAEAQDYFRNIDSLVGALVKTVLWQPSTDYKYGDVVRSDGLPRDVVAVCVSENGGKTSSVEPSWGNVGGANILDGTCFWQLRVVGTVTSIDGIKPNANGEVVLPAPPVSSVNGETGDVNVGEVTYVSISGKTITVTYANGDTETLTTQDTTYTAGNGLVLNGTEFSITDGGDGGSAYKVPYAICSTGTYTGAKVATIINDVPFSLEPGAIVFVKFTNYQNSYPTLNVNSTGAKTVQFKGENASGDYYAPPIGKNGILKFMYDGTYWQCYENVVYYPDSGGE